MVKACVPSLPHLAREQEDQIVEGVEADLRHVNTVRFSLSSSRQGGGEDGQTRSVHPHAPVLEAGAYIMPTRKISPPP